VLANKIKGGMHRHFNREDRIALGALLRAGLSQTEIGRQLGFNRSSVSRVTPKTGTPELVMFYSFALFNSEDRDSGAGIPK
jgi:hypothetical protein